MCSLSSPTDEAMRFVTHYAFEILDFLILDEQLFIKSDKWLKRDEYQSERDVLPLVLAALP